jgi:hypothetical protein
MLFSLGAMVIGTPLLIGLPKISIPVGPIMYQQESDTDLPEPLPEPEPRA